MNDWTKFIEKWFNELQIAFADYEFDIMKQELLLGFDELTEDFDRVFNDDSNEMELSESYITSFCPVLLLHHTTYTFSPDAARGASSLSLLVYAVASCSCIGDSVGAFVIVVTKRRVIIAAIKPIFGFMQFCKKKAPI